MSSNKPLPAESGDSYLSQLIKSIKHSLVRAIYTIVLVFCLWLVFRYLLAPSVAKDLVLTKGAAVPWSIGVLIIVEYFPLATLRMIRYVIKHPEESGETQLLQWHLREILPLLANAAFYALMYRLLHWVSHLL